MISSLRRNALPRPQAGSHFSSGRNRSRCNHCGCSAGVADEAGRLTSAGTYNCRIQSATNIHGKTQEPSPPTADLRLVIQAICVMVFRKRRKETR